MEFGFNIDTALSVIPVVLALLVCFMLLRIHWKQYGLLLAAVAAVGYAICYGSVMLGLYSFPFLLFSRFTCCPTATLIVVFPAYAAVAVRYSPRSWIWKIPFYWALVHLVTLTEGFVEKHTQIIRYSENWTIWESYLLWWVFLLAFEWLGGKIVKPENRKPMDPAILRYGKPGWLILHAVLISTVLMAGTILPR